MFRKFISHKQNVMCTAGCLLAITISVTIIQLRTYGDHSNNKVMSTAFSGQEIQFLETEDTKISEDDWKTMQDSLTVTSEFETTLPVEEIKIHTYTVKLGDTLSSIANTYNVKVSTISESNKIVSDSALKDGQVLEFPSVDGILHKIRNGETLWDIAVANKIDVNRIIEVNKLEAPDKLKLDQKLIIPDVDKLKLVATNNSTSTSTATSNKTISRGGDAISFSIPVRGKITSPFGPRAGGMHTGIDIAAPTGTPIYASAGGQVTFSGWSGGYGNLVIIDHKNGMETYYAHNSRNLVNKGQTISMGTHIANVGNTGNSTGPHCHFEIRRNGTPLNPLSFIR